MVAIFKDSNIAQTQVSNPARDNNIDRSKFEIISPYSNSTALVGLWLLTISNGVSTSNTINVLNIAFNFYYLNHIQNCKVH